MATVNLLLLLHPQCCRFGLQSTSCLSFREPYPLAYAAAFSSSASSKLRYSPFLLRSRRPLLEGKTRSSPEGVSRELVEDPKFVPLNADDPVYGPPALLLMGFDLDETHKLRTFLKELDGDFLKIIHCTAEMMIQSVWDAVHTEQPNLEDVKIEKSLPRICLLSGLTGEEMMMFVDSFQDTGLKPAVFAALVPNSAHKLLKDVAEEIMGDHEMMSANQNS
ncbi:hypothetical protein AXF42_Ash015824 [Apostasia shenzhenica]|uniref:Uncharacterized protein n=1 Tax=Apostasia shenzhenica TaxID=1088818 RepID=A0A2H9ZXM8_9ASPA|nr:hypothetical protein AXF42_Ash015824 [Apostasia shenzhenica]